LAFLSPRFESRPTKYQKLALMDLNQPTRFGYPVIDQVDIVPTLATLFAFPIPKNNLGKIILDVVKPQMGK
jgi:ethanolamine phosphate transferase 2 subunit G